MPAKNEKRGKSISDMDLEGGCAPLPGDLGRIAEIAGEEAALKIAREFRGTHIYIPDVFKRLRDEKIRMQYDGGLSARAIAIKHRISERTVWDVLKKPRRPLSPLLRKFMED